jgi:hypothetical protein
MVKNSGLYSYSIRFFPLKESFYLAAIEAFGAVCEYIPDTLQSEQFFIEAVKVNKNGKALKYVPDEYRSVKVCLAALQRHPDMAGEIMGYVPESLQERVKAAAGID